MTQYFKRSAVAVVCISLTIHSCAVINSSEENTEFGSKGGVLIFKERLAPIDMDRFNYFVSGKNFQSASLRNNPSGNINLKAYLEIGKQLKKMKLDVSVDGFCVQGCANYLFLAGKTRERTNGGIIGFKDSLLNYDEATVIRNFLNFTTNPDERSIYLADFRKDRMQELEFLNDIGVSRDLFDDAQKMTLAYAKYLELLGAPYTYNVFWVPDNSELSCYGVTGLKGDFSLKGQYEVENTRSGTHFFSTKSLKTKPLGLTKCVK